VGGRDADYRRGLEEALAAAGRVPDRKLWTDSPPSVAFHRFIIERYRPPKEKRFLVFFQCSVRRPFSKSPSHGSMRRAVATATGFWPAKDFASCPVHVVVLASKLGPVPYELEDVYPANVRGGGVKHFSPEAYAEALPVLAGRMAEYIRAHRDHYRRMASFTQGRYAEVTREAARLARVRLKIFPDEKGPVVQRMGRSLPRTYWAKYWIQLDLEIVGWLDPAGRERAAARLRKLKVKFG
jgi:predicted RNA-binding protein